MYRIFAMKRTSLVRSPFHSQMHSRTFGLETWSLNESTKVLSQLKLTQAIIFQGTNESLGSQNFSNIDSYKGQHKLTFCKLFWTRFQQKWIILSHPKLFLFFNDNESEYLKLFSREIFFTEWIVHPMTFHEYSWNAKSMLLQICRL